MQEVMIKTHLIVTDVHEEYFVNWCGKIVDTKPLLQNGMPIFVIIADGRRVEINTIDIKRIETCAKQMTYPRGKQARTRDVARIYLKEEDGNEVLMGKVIHDHVKQYQQMYDRFDKI